MTPSIDSSAASLASSASASVTPESTGSEPRKSRSASWQNFSASPAATGSAGASSDLVVLQKLITRPSCSCGPGGSSSDGATTGAPAAARCDVIASSRRCHAVARADRRDRARDARDDRRGAQVDEDVELVAQDDGVVAAEAVGLRHGHGRR